MKTKTIIYVAVTLILALSNKVMASTFTYKGKEITKGEAMMISMKDQSAVITKTDIVKFDSVKGTLKNVKTSKK